MKRLLALACCVLAAPTLATAETFYRPASTFSGPHPAVVRVVAPEAGSASYGSGTLVAINESSGLVLTNWHVVRDATGTIVVYFPDGFRSGAQILRTDRDWDLAALAIRRPNAQPVPIAVTPPKPGEELTIAGYGSGSYRAVTGRVTQYLSPGGNQPYEMVELSAPARNGDSGGPILNERGELAGTLFGSAFGRTTGSYCGRLRWFVGNVDSDFRRISLQALLAQQSQRQPTTAGQNIAAYNTGAPGVAPPQQPYSAESQGPAVTTAAAPYAWNAARPPEQPVQLAASPNYSAWQGPANPHAAAAGPWQTPETSGRPQMGPSVSAPPAPAPMAPVAAIAACPRNELPRIDQFKSILALVGALAVLYHAIRFLGWAVG